MKILLGFAWGVITPFLMASSLFAADKPLPLGWNWTTNPPAEYLIVAHTTSLTANPNPETWPVLKIVPGYTVTPPAPAGATLNLTFADATGTNWFGVFYAADTQSFTTNQLVPVLQTTFVINPTSSDFFAVRGSNTWAGVGPFSNVAGVLGPPAAAQAYLK